MKLSELRGVVPPIATPFDENGNLDESSLVRLTNHLLDNGVHGIFCLGSTGECAALTCEERQKVVKTVVKTTASRAPVLVGITENSTKKVVALGHQAAVLGADAVVLAPPFYHRNSQAEVVQHFREVARQLPIPVVAYNVPVLVKTPLTPETVEVLAREGSIIAIKDSGGDSNILREYIRRTADIPNFTVLTGMEFLVDTAIHMGAHGCVPGIGNVVPKEYVELYEAAIKGDYHTARSLQEKLIDLFNICYQGSPDLSPSASALSGFKSALRWLGIFKTAKMAPPLGTLSPEAEYKVLAILQKLGVVA